MVSEQTYDHVKLLAIEEQIRAQVGAIDDAWPVVGQHCDSSYCPARAGCELYQLNRKGAA